MKPFLLALFFLPILTFAWLRTLPGCASPHARSVLTQAPSSYRLPYIYWPYGIETAQSVKQAGINEICVPDAEKDNWQAAGFKILTDRNLNFEQREKLIVPGILRRANIASPTSRPWIEANGWRFIRNPAGKYYYELPAGKGALAAAEAFTYGVDAVLKIDQSDLEEMGKMLAFQRRLPQDVLPVVADIGVIDDQTPLTGEVMNLLTRRNLLFKIVAAPSSEYAVNIKIGTSEFPESDAADPSSFAQKIRRLLTDEKRTLRIYGNEVVICRLTGKGSHLRLQLLNYSGREIDGMRVRLLGSYRKIHLMAFAYNPIPPEDMLISEGATEFTIPKIGTYTQVELDN